MTTSRSTTRGMCYNRKGSSDSVHARVRRLQAVDRQQTHLDRAHRPAARRDPELLPVSCAAELLSRSARHTRGERPVTPQAASIQRELLGRFEHPSNRPTPTGCGNYPMVRRYARGPHACRDQRFGAFLNDFQCIRHLSIIHTEASNYNIQITGLPNSGPSKR
jgi:hypothetical protein